ncbi:MAG TPA: L-threonylcarbamoyladenylate synthase [Myxococcota bacterium]|nr:L-threonylcarbamoyladenylate synthase [Myxococcota bacterium]
MIAAAVDALRRPGGVVCYPTETVYGLGGRASDGASADRIAVLKGRPLQPLIVLVEGIEWLDGEARQLASELWPGPVTLVVPGWPGVADEVLAPDGTVGVRWSGHPVCASLVEAVGPITSTSANLHGEPPPREAPSFDVDAVVDVGALSFAEQSTIVHVAARRILRRGALAHRVERLLADLD